MPNMRFAKFHGSLLSVAMLFAALVGSALLLFAGHTTYRNRLARQWPLTDGRIVSSRTFLQDASLGKPGNARIARADVRYTYEVDGRWYESSNVSYARGIGGTRQVYDSSYAVTYPAGTRVRVAYNPARPSDAVIDASRDPYFTLALGALLVLSFVGYQIWLRSGGEVATAP